MNYKKIYEGLCRSRKVRGTKKEDGYEVHHIKPKSMGGSNLKQNLVKLTYKEHFLAHKLLCRITTGMDKINMDLAVDYMVKSGGHNIRCSRDYHTIKDNSNTARRLILYKRFVKNSSPHMRGAEYLPLSKLDCSLNGNKIPETLVDFIDTVAKTLPKEFSLTKVRRLELASLITILVYLSNETTTKRGMIHYNSWYNAGKIRQELIHHLELLGYLKVYKMTNKSEPIVIEALKDPQLKLPFKTYKLSDNKTDIRSYVKIPDGLFIIKVRGKVDVKRYMLRPRKWEFKEDQVELYRKYCFYPMSFSELVRLCV